MCAKVLPNLRLAQFRIERACGPEADGFADQVIAALRAGVAKSLGGAPGVRGNHGNKQSNALGGARWRANEGVQREGPSQDAQGALLPADPERTGHGRAVTGPVLDGAPEGLGKVLVAGESIGP